MVLLLFFFLCFANQLGHRPHGAIYTPATGFEPHHGDQSQHRGGQHHAVKSKSELSHAGMEQGAMIGPIPRNLEGPQQCDYLPEILGPCKDQVCIPEHLEKHDEKPNQETVAERFAFHPFWDVLFPGEAKPAAQQAEYLSPTAVTVAVALCPPVRWR